MPNRLVDAVSPYLRSHADNPVDWWGWGPEPFIEAAARDVPVLVSIGYSTCHWCHVMARESFSDPELADYLNERFVAIKVDREEHPDVDATYLAAAGAFTENLGWPLNVFVTPGGKTFYAGTYFPPRPVQGHPAFRQVLEAVTDAWRERRAEVDSTADAIAGALADASAAPDPGGRALPDADEFARVARQLEQYEDREHGGFGGAPKFPVAPVLSMLLDLGSQGDRDAAALAARTLDAMARSDLRDEVEGGFFRYSTMRDWTDPHYERMLYDNALLLGAYARVGADGAAAGIASFLARVLRLPSGAFASAQDSESTVDGERVEGGYYSLDAAGRARQHPPALDEKVLTGWNGLAIGALASAGVRLHRADWIDLATAAADDLLRRHLLDDGTLVRASIGDRVSEAKATLEDYGMFAGGLLELSLATGEVRYAGAARSLIDSTMRAGEDADGAAPTFAAPGGADPVLVAHGLALEVDPSEGAYPSGVSATAGAAYVLYLLTGDQRYRRASEAAMLPLAEQATQRPIGFGAALAVLRALAAPVTQLVVIAEEDRREDEVVSLASGFDRAGGVAVIVTAEQAMAFASAGFELLAGRTGIAAARAYLCSDFVCRLPVTDATELRRELDSR